MRINTDTDRVKCWLTRSEIDALARHAPHREGELAVRLMGDCGLRSFETIQICPKHKRRSEDGSAWLLRVPRGKDTKDGDGKARDTYLPKSTEQLLHSYQRDEALAPSEQYITVTPRSVRRWVDHAAANAHEATGRGDWMHVSSHDLRRSWATYLLVEERRNARIMLAAGGWSDFESIKPYLAEATEGAIVDELSNVEF
ncbi:tyrosine-type recombinase/integrase [Natrialbaceae archaeon A-CW1-1]